jgi:hypothetical protein
MWTGTTPRGVSGVDVDGLVRVTCRVGATLLYDLFVHVGSQTPSDRGGVVRETLEEFSFRVWLYGLGSQAEPGLGCRGVMTGRSDGRAGAVNSREALFS